MDTNWIYYGIFFNDKTKALLFEKAKPYIPEGWKTYCHHMTIIFNDKSEEKYREAEALDICVGNHESLMVTGVGISDRAVAFSVDYQTQNKVSHITIATAPGAKPVESNNITNWKPIEPFYVTGIVDKFTKNGNTMKITESELKTIVAESVKRILKENDYIGEQITDYESLFDSIQYYVERHIEEIDADLEKGTDYETLFNDMWFVTSSYIDPYNFGEPGHRVQSMEEIKNEALTAFKHYVGRIHYEEEQAMKKRPVSEGLIHTTEYGNDIVFKAQLPSQIFKLNNWTYRTESKDNGVLMLRCYTDNNNSFEMGNFPAFEKVVDDLNKFYKYHGSKTVAQALPDDGVSRGRLLKVYKRA